jgi:hypothetical protein
VDPTDFPRALGYGFSGAEERTTSASVAKFGKDQHRALEDRQGIEAAHLGTFSAEGAPGLVHFGNRKANRELSFFLKRKKEMQIRLLYIAVEELNLGYG